MDKVGFILEKNDSPLFVRSHVHVIKENGSNFVDFRLSDDDFKLLYIYLCYGISLDVNGLSNLVDLFESIYSRL